MFGKMFGKKASAAKAEMAKIENRDLMQAIIAGCLLVSCADGEIEKSETEALDKMLQANPSMKHFGSEITETITRFTGMLEAGKALGKIKVMREIADIKSNPDDAAEAFACMIDIAMSDGDVEEAELKVLKEIGASLGLRVTDFGLAV